MKKPVLIIPVENQVRELDAKLLLVCVAAKRDLASIIGPKRKIENHIASFPRGIFLSKSLRIAKRRFFPISRLLGHEIVAWDEEALVHLTKRNRTLVRANNLRRGMTRKDEKPPEDHWKRRFPELESKLLDEYYKYKGWNLEGVPTRETLHDLGLDYVYEDFVERGILKEEGVAAGGATSKGSAS